MIVTNEKHKFISESLSGELKKHAKKFQDENKEYLEASIRNNTYDEVYTKMVSDVVIESYDVMNSWENIAYEEIGGMTPLQYFGILNNLSDVIDLVVAFEVENAGIIPNGLAKHIKASQDKLLDDLVAMLNSLELDEQKCMKFGQKAVMHTAEIIGDTKLLEPLFKIVSQMEDQKTDANTLTAVMNAIQAIGEPAIERVVSAIESSDKKGQVYRFLLISLARIGSKNKSDAVYNQLKKYFKESSYKFIEANALGVYGDRRALPAIRGYIEKNAHKISKWEYTQLREVLIQFGGMVQDFDTYFSTVKDM
ncbi:MAG TPA: hypothetical protein VIO64_08260 [Pseudobacteroides sp.]|uniref:hypothetical protein n=1 Tax=Pseudobacteroides sp. TaxID=1968840 RepID=UPI002F94D8E8